MDFVSHDSTSNEPSQILSCALEAFLTHGFHAVKTNELEDATGCSWQDLCASYGDKEGLFIASVEQVLADGSRHVFGKTAEVLGMLEVLERVKGNPRLKIIHKLPLVKLTSLADTQKASVESQPKQTNEPRAW